jgi:hypothetical protein
LFEEQLVNDPRQRVSRCFFSQPKGQLMERQYPEIQKRQPVFDGEQGAKAIG